MIIQFSTGGRSGAGQELGLHLAAQPDMGSLATGSVNFPNRVYDNPPDLVEWLATRMRDLGIKPEVEAFDLSMLFQAASLRERGLITGALQVQFVNSAGIAAPAWKTTCAWTGTPWPRPTPPWCARWCLCELHHRPVATARQARALLGLAPVRPGTAGPKAPA